MFVSTKVLLAALVFTHPYRRLEALVFHCIPVGGSQRVCLYQGSASSPSVRTLQRCLVSDSVQGVVI